MIARAIKKINPSAKFIYHNDDIDTIEWLEGTTPISKSDIEVQIPILEKEIADAATKKATDKTSGKAKLKSGEALTDAEISALFGA